LEKVVNYVNSVSETNTSCWLFLNCHEYQTKISIFGRLLKYLKLTIHCNHIIFLNWKMQYKRRYEIPEMRSRQIMVTVIDVSAFSVWSLKNFIIFPSMNSSRISTLPSRPSMRLKKQCLKINFSP